MTSEDKVTPVNAFSRLPRAKLPPVSDADLERTDRIAEQAGFPSREPKSDSENAAVPASGGAQRVRPVREPMRNINIRMSASEADRLVAFSNTGNRGGPFASYREALVHLLDLADRIEGRT